MVPRGLETLGEKELWWGHPLSHTAGSSFHAWEMRAVQVPKATVEQRLGVPAHHWRVIARAGPHLEVAQRARPTFPGSNCKYLTPTKFFFIYEHFHSCTLISITSSFSPLSCSESSSFLLLLLLFLEGFLTFCFQPGFREFPFPPALPSLPDAACLLVSPVFPFLSQDLSLSLYLR